MIREYIAAAMKRAHYEILEDDNSFYGEVPECNGVYANASSLEECRNTLEEVLEGWILFRVSQNLDVPIIDDIDLIVKEVSYSSCQEFFR